MCACVVLGGQRGGGWRAGGIRGCGEGKGRPSQRAVMGSALKGEGL